MGKMPLSVQLISILPWGHRKGYGGKCVLHRGGVSALFLTNWEKIKQCGKRMLDDDFLVKV